MDKIVLEQYASIKREIKGLKKRIDRTQKEIQKLDGLIVSDTVKGTRPDGTYGPIKITGLEKRSYEKQRSHLKRLKEKLMRAKEKLEEKKLEVEEYVESLEDSDLRDIIRYHCIDELKWRDVSQKMGGRFGLGEDSCRKKFNEFMKE